jgi:hypothetical protein
MLVEQYVRWEPGHGLAYTVMLYREYREDPLGVGQGKTLDEAVRDAVSKMEDD